MIAWYNGLIKSTKEQIVKFEVYTYDKSGKDVIVKVEAESQELALTVVGAYGYEPIDMIKEVE